MTAVEPDVIVSGDLVRIRQKRRRDAFQDWTWRRDADLARLDAARVTALSFDEYRNQYEWQLQRSQAYRSTFAVEAHDGRHIGNVMYYNIDAQRREAELGVLIGEREFWGGGYGREAVALLQESGESVVPIGEIVYRSTRSSAGELLLAPGLPYTLAAS